MQVEMPREMEVMDPELFFRGDSRGKWSLMYSKLRSVSGITEEAIKEYPTFLMHLHHLAMGTAKEFYRIYRIKRKIN